MLDNQHEVNVEMVFKRGKLVYDGHDVEIAAPDIDPDILAGVLDTFHLPEVTPEQLRIGVAPLIGLIDGQIVTEDLGHAEGVDGGICQMTVCERHHDTGHVASCYVRGYGIQRGAVATSIAHDSHNIIACGVSPEDIAFAVNELKKMQKDFGITTIYVTHDQEEALTMSDTIVVMNQGYIQQVGTPEDIIMNRRMRSLQTLSVTVTFFLPRWYMTGSSISSAPTFRVSMKDSVRRNLLMQ